MREMTPEGAAEYRKWWMEKATPETKLMFAAFLDELHQIQLSKEAGMVDTLKRLALTDVGGPQGVILPALRAGGESSKVTKGALKGVRSAQKTRRTSGGAYDVSALAAQMGV